MYSLILATWLIGVTVAFLPDENPNLFEGDIILDPNQREALKRGHTYAATKGKLWPLTIPYEFDDKLQNNQKIQDAVRLAIAHYKEHTCLRFVPKTSYNQREYIRFVYSGSGCSSHIGTNGGERKIAIGPSCEDHWQVIVHELMHAIGFWHEQSRPDRDNYIKIIWENLPLDARINFKKYGRSEIDSLKVPYDLESITHYTESAWTGSNSRLSIKTLDPSKQHLLANDRKNNGLSALDIKQIQLLYKCNGNQANTLHPPTEPPCQDYNTICGRYKDKCLNPKGDALRDWMEKDCPKTCGFCK